MTVDAREYFVVTHAVAGHQVRLGDEGMPSAPVEVAKLAHSVRRSKDRAEPRACVASCARACARARRRRVAARLV